MKLQILHKLIRALKINNEINNLFGDNIAYSAFFNDLEGLGLLIQPLNVKEKHCYNRELVQIQIIDKKDDSTREQMKGYMETVENFLNSHLKNFEGFETLRVKDNGDEMILKNDKERLVFSKRFYFFYGN